MDKDYFDLVFNTKYIEEDKDEHWDLINYVEKENPKIIVEIGVKSGGSLLLWQKLVPEDGIVIGIDIDADVCLKGFRQNKIYYKLHPMEYFPNFLYQLNDTNMYVIFSDSTGCMCKEVVKKLIKEQPISFLFIDGYHYSPIPLKDFQNFIDLVRPGGLVCCADIGDRDLNLGGEDGTRDLWYNLPEGKKLTKMLHHHQGMGLFWKEKSNEVKL